MTQALPNDLQIACELERQILEVQIWDKVRPVVQEVTAQFVDRELTEAMIVTAQRLLEEKLRSLGPGFPIPGIRLVLKRHPEDRFSLVLELEDE